MFYFNNLKNVKIKATKKFLSSNSHKISEQWLSYEANNWMILLQPSMHIGDYGCKVYIHCTDESPCNNCTSLDYRVTGLIW